MKKIYLLFISLFWISGCSDEPETTDPTPANAFKAFGEQSVEALEEAKQVEQLLQQGADKNQQIIEEQSR